MSFAAFLKDAEQYLTKEDAFKIQPSSEFKKKYEMLKRLGNGAFSEVYLTKEKETGELFASKMINREQIASPKHLWNEIHILNSLDHPSIIKLKDAYANKKYVTMVLEYASGGELLEHMYSMEDYDESEALRIIHDLLDALNYLHNKRVVHRDIKPENILFTNDILKKLKLSDFGLSGIMKENNLLSTCAGTPGFMAPEVIKSNGYGVECDMWSVGVLAYFLLSGVLPFNSNVPFKLYQSILNAEYEFGPEFEDISEEAKDFITKCIKVKPKERLTAKQALKHPWIDPFEMGGMIKTREVIIDPVAMANQKKLPAIRLKILNFLDQRRKMKTYQATNMAISFVSKLKLKAKLAKKFVSESKADAEGTLNININDNEVVEVDDEISDNDENQENQTNDNSVPNQEPKKLLTASMKIIAAHKPPSVA